MSELSGQSEIKALLTLIDEPDEVNFARIRERIMSYGSSALDQLEGLLDQYFENEIQERILDLIQDIQFNLVYSELAQWSLNEPFNLLRGVYIVSRFAYPNLAYKDVHAKIDAIIRDVWLEMNDDLTALEKVKVVNHVLYDIHRFSPNREEMHIPQNFFINTLLETKKGSPLALGILYMLITRALGIPVYGVNLPQHFILAYTREDSLESDRLPTSDDVLFYINPFNLGSVFTRSEIELFLRQLKLKEDPSHFSPCSNETIIRRLISNLIIAFEKSSRPEKAEALRQLIAALNPQDSTEEPYHG